jgi:exonuclease I
MDIQLHLKHLAELLQKMQSAGVHDAEFYKAYVDYLHACHDFSVAFDSLIRDDEQARNIYFSPTGDKPSTTSSPQRGEACI